MANFFETPIGSAAGALVAGTSGAFQGATWLASELAKFGKIAGGTPGEVTFAFLGAGTGAMGGFFLGSILGGLSGWNMVRYFAGNLQQVAPQGTQGTAAGGDEVERFAAWLRATSGE